MPTSASRLDEEKRLNGIKWYQPHEKQRPFHSTVSKIRALFGGNRSGKTHGGCAEDAFWATHSQRYRLRPRRKDIKILIGSESNEYNRDIIVPKLRTLIPQSLIIKETRIQRGMIDFWNLPDGGKIKFKNYEQDVDKWAGDDYNLIHLDEESPPEIFKECLLRTIDRNGEIILTMTPVKGLTWVYQDVYEKDGTNGIKCFVMDMDSNPYLAQADKDLVLANLTEQEKLIRKEGKFVALQGLIYPDFKDDLHCIDDFEIPLGWRRIVGIDPHLKKATSVVWAAIATENRGQIKRGDYIVYREARRRGETPDIVKMIQIANGPQERIFCYVIDPAKPNVNEEWPGQTIIDVYASLGIPAQKANKAVEQGVSAVRARLDATPPTLWIFKSCIGCIWEFKHYMYNDPVDLAGKPYSEKIFKKDDDYMDDIRYIVNTGIPPARLSDYQPQVMEYSETGRPLGVRNA